MPSIEMFHKYLCNVVLIATIKFYLNGAKIQGHNEFYIQDFPPPLRGFPEGLRKVISDIVATSACFDLLRLFLKGTTCWISGSVLLREQILVFLC